MAPGLIAKPSQTNTKAGLSLNSESNNPNPIQHGAMGQAERAFSATSTFLSGIMAISASQLVAAPLKLVDPKLYENYMAWTKECFAVLMTTITQWWAPTVIRVSGDDSMQGQFYQMNDGTLKCNFPHRLVLMGNHQLYTDWLYLWWIAYTNKTHGRIYIVLKESLKRLPIIGWGMQFYNFIFLGRNWERDRIQFQQHLSGLKDPRDPMWLLIFPEGTNLSAETREKSSAWSLKTGIPDMKHQLLPRTTGLQFCLRELQASTNWLYDCTIAYEGIPSGLYGQDIFTLKSSFLEGRPPRSVNMFWRRFRISDIPSDQDEAFHRWLLNRWREKDYLLEYYYKFGRFPAEKPVQALAAVNGQAAPKHARSISTFVKGGGWDEFLGIFGPITTAAGTLAAVDLTEPLSLDDLARRMTQSQQVNLFSLARSIKYPMGQDVIRKILDAAEGSSTLPKAIQPQPPSHTIAKARSSQTPTFKPATSLSTSISKNRIRPSSSLPPSSARPPASRSPQTTAPKPTQELHSSVPLSTTSMITRPLSTLAVQTAASQTLKATRPAPPASSSQTTRPRQVARAGHDAPKRPSTRPTSVKSLPVRGRAALS